MLAVLASCLLGALVLAACSGSDDEANTGPLTETTPSGAVGDDVVVHVDATSGRVRAVIPVGPDPLLMMPAAGQVWAGHSDGTLSRVDPATERAATVDLGETAGFTADGDDLWVAVDGNRLMRIDGATGTVKSSFRLGSRPLFAQGDAGFIVVGGGSLWLTVPELGHETKPQSLWRVDPRTGDVLSKIPIGIDPLPLVSDGRYVWLMSFDEGLTRIDTASGRKMLVSLPNRPIAVARGAGSVWVGYELTNAVVRLDPSSAKETATIAVGGGVRGVGYGGGFVWVTTEETLERIDPATNEATRMLRIMSANADFGPFSVAYLDGSVWFSVG